MFVLHVNEKLTLRMLSARDAAPLFTLIDTNRAYLSEWLPWLDSTQTAEDSLAFIKASFYTYNDRKGITAGIFYEEQLVGVLSYNTLHWQANIGSLGYWLAASHQGKGIMTTAVAAMIQYGFTELKLNRIEIRVAAGNTPSQAIPERLHFQLEGKIRSAEWLNGRFVDHHLYGLLKSDDSVC